MKTTRYADRPTEGSPTEVLHGQVIEDPFRWLEDQDAPATRAFLARQRKRLQEYFDRHAGLRQRIRSRVTELLTVETRDLPIPDCRGGLFYLMRKADDERKSLYHQDRDESERLLLSAEDFEADASMAILHVSPRGRCLVLGIRIGGGEFQEIRFYDAENQQLLPDRLEPGLDRGIAFSEDETCIFYSKEDATGRYQWRRAIRRHRVGDTLGEDQEVFNAGEGPDLRLIVRGAIDANTLGYLAVSLQDTLETKFFVHDAPFDAQPRPLTSLRGAAFGPIVFHDRIEAITTLDAPRGRAVTLAVSSPASPLAWKTILPEARGQLFAYVPLGNLRIAHSLIDGRKFTRVYSLHGALRQTIEYPQDGTVVLGPIDPITRKLFYSHSDVDTPPSIFMVDLESGEHRLWWRQEARRSLTTPLHQERIEYPSSDGTLVPMTLIGPADQKRPTPVLLSAYGASGGSSTPRFSVLLHVLVQEGVLSATAHVRGGGEHGIQWHEAARKDRKQTSVDDLIGAAQWLVSKGYAHEHAVGLAGQSYGALLALCALTQAPQLFRAVLALGPLADLTRFHLFGAARNFVGELGSPEDAAEFPALYRLSPYHRVDDTERYPSVLIVSGDLDQRCDALHARKMVARLQAVPEQSAPILLDYNEVRGHKPGLPLQARIDGLTDRLTFLIAELAGNCARLA